MPENSDYNTLLLRLLAHDLLAPLTAVKWQVELLAKEKKGAKRERYLKGISESTELGISLAKHAHVASKILSHTYEICPPEEVELGGLVQETSGELVLQYGRHALTLETNIKNENKNRALDRELVSLLVWSMGKFFLSAARPYTTVRMYGENKSDGAYVLRITSNEIPEKESLKMLFSGEVSAGEFDQAYIFSKLIIESAQKINVSVTVESKENEFALIATFSA